jgi:hypothetical protein
MVSDVARRALAVSPAAEAAGLAELAPAAGGLARGAPQAESPDAEPASRRRDQRAATELTGILDPLYRAAA